MTREEIYREIDRVCQKMMSYTAIHSENKDEIRAESIRQSDKLISMILNSAKSAVKRSYRVYESFRVQLANSATTSDQYTTAIRKLADILKV